MNDILTGSLNHDVDVTSVRQLCEKPILNVWQPNNKEEWDKTEQREDRMSHEEWQWTGVQGRCIHRHVDDVEGVALLFYFSSIDLYIFITESGRKRGSRFLCGWTRTRVRFVCGVNAPDLWPTHLQGLRLMFEPEWHRMLCQDCYWPVDQYWPSSHDIWCGVWATVKTT